MVLSGSEVILIGFEWFSLVLYGFEEVVNGLE